MVIPFVEAFRNHPRIKSSGVDPAVFEAAVDLMALVLGRTPLNVTDFFNTAALKEAEKLIRVDPTAATMKCLFRGQVDDPATSRRIFPPRCACATASLMEERG
jgi:hypothetical protein